MVRIFCNLAVSALAMTSLSSCGLLSASIEGDAYLQEEGALTGMKVHLCSSDLRSEFEKIYSAKKPDISSYAYEVQHLNAVAALHDFAELECLSVAQTDISGHYEFVGVEPGDYLVFAAKWGLDRKTTPYWLVPIKAERGKTIERDLNSSEWGIDGKML